MSTSADRSKSPLIVGLGEALIDAMPDGDRLGGAPLNVAVHARQLGNASAVVSRVGDDPRGRFIAGELHRFGVEGRGLQVDLERPTGAVDVTFDAEGEPAYSFVPDAAWDRIRFDASAAAVARAAAGVCFGTLAQRSAPSRSAVLEFVESASGAITLFDVNLRQRFFDRATIEASLRRATAAKMNVDELAVVCNLLALDSVPRLLDLYELRWVALTRGSLGSVVYTRDGLFESDPVPVDVSLGNPVGAGDSVSAALLHGAVRDWPWVRTLALANRIGAFVASRPEACPPLPEELFELLEQEEVSA